MNLTNQPQARQAEYSYSGALAKNFISNVFSWMGIALAITAVTAYFFGTDEDLISMLYTENGMSGLGWVVMFAPFAIILIMNFGFNKLSYSALVAVFGIYSILMGMSLSFILLIYTSSSIFQTFIVTSLMFVVMAVVGYTTKTDLTKFGSLLMMALVGIIIASVVNMFMGSSTMDYIISFVGVLIFTGLTAYDVQKLKRIGAGIDFPSEHVNKLAIMGALNLYLDFINLFLFLLRFMGDRK
ncbi:MAG: Bax inhibitor-1/YccA family protein [Bacteroidales bacterium]|nr:Bax inhibitor-1/YccA family protein [Bacteroidales bacterium]